jgi:hypothetical protein
MQVFPGYARGNLQTPTGEPMREAREEKEETHSYSPT